MMEAYDKRREKMVDTELIQRNIKDQRVIESFRKIPRELFVDNPDYDPYEPAPIPIGYEQTISEPYITALMIEALELTIDDVVLEIGTGSGYQTAILSTLCKEVYTMERIKELLIKAEERLEKLNCKNIRYRLSDGTEGWLEHGTKGAELRKFDKIIVSAAAPSIPPPLLKSLNDNGILVIPVGDYDLQELLQIKKIGGKVTERKLCSCRFVKLIGKHGWLS